MTCVFRVLHDCVVSGFPHLMLSAGNPTLHAIELRGVNRTLFDLHKLFRANGGRMVWRQDDGVSPMLGV